MNREKNSHKSDFELDDYQVHEFPSGLRLIYKQVAETNISHCGFIIDAGSRDEPLSKSGLAHFLEHMLFKGTEKRKYHQILNRLEVVGGDLNAYTTKDKTCIYASIVDIHTERAIELLSDITFNSVFPEHEIEKEKKVIAEEIAMYEDTPEETIFDEFQELVYPKHPLGVPILGTRKHLAAFTKDDLLQFQEKNYSPRSIVFSYVGKLPMNKVLRMLEKYTSSLPARSKRTKRKPFHGYKAFQVSKSSSQNQTYCIIGNLAYDNSHPKKHVLLLMNNILGGPGLNSRLNLIIREKYGYAYNVESNYFPFTDSGMINIFIGMDKKNLDHCLEIVDSELKTLRRKKMSSLSLHRYINQFTGQVMMAEESKVSLMLALGKALLDHDHVDTLQEVLDKVQNVNAAQIMDVANELFQPADMSRLTYIQK